MKLLVSAFACSPYMGSESGVGWSAICRMAKYHDVYVLAHENNKPMWDKALAEGNVPCNVSVRFICKHELEVRNRFIGRVQHWLWYWQFNRNVLDAAVKWHKEICFDLCHQVTIATWRLPSPLWRLPIPFIWGPVGGAGTIPKSFRTMLSIKARVFEIIRDLQTWKATHSAAFTNCISHADVVIAANRETYVMLLPYRKGRPIEQLPVWAISPETLQTLRRKKHAPKLGPLKLFAGGMVEGRKGFRIALESLALIAAKGIKFHYTIAGIGPEIGHLKQVAERLGIASNVTFHPGYKGDEYIQILQESDVYFMPSFRETLGMTLVEALIAGCYPVVADVSAQGEIVRMTGGSAVPIEDMDTLRTGLADALTWCDKNRDKLIEFSESAVPILADYFSSERYEHVINECYMRKI